jgi:hypothetical protein|tara:strand:- start:174 stop:356 length:183 start_codon:yes stop_codon:yes gene_type:complete
MEEYIMVGMLMQKRIANLEWVIKRCSPEFKEVWERKLEQLINRRVEMAHERMVENARRVH